MAILDDILQIVSADLPMIVGKVNNSLAAAGTSLPALEGGVSAIIKDLMADPAQALPKVLVDGAEIAFAGNPAIAAAIAVGYALYASGLVQPADQAFFDTLDASKGDGNPYATITD